MVFEGGRTHDESTALVFFGLGEVLHAVQDLNPGALVDLEELVIVFPKR